MGVRFVAMSIIAYHFDVMLIHSDTYTLEMPMHQGFHNVVGMVGAFLRTLCPHCLLFVRTCKHVSFWGEKLTCIRLFA